MSISLPPMTLGKCIVLPNSISDFQISGSPKNPGPGAPGHPLIFNLYKKVVLPAPSKPNMRN